MAVAAEVALIAEDPWGYRRRSGEPAGSHFAHRTVPVVDGRGMVTFLILDHASKVHITSITWFG